MFSLHLFSFCFVSRLDMRRAGEKVKYMQFILINYFFLNIEFCDFFFLSLLYYFVLVDRLFEFV